MVMYELVYEILGELEGRVAAARAAFDAAQAEFVSICAGNSWTAEDLRYVADAARKLKERR